MSKNLRFCLFIALLVPMLWADSRAQEIIKYPQNYTYHYGDNPDWKNLNFNDSKWEKTSLDSFS
jgi:hypothetical protein